MLLYRVIWRNEDGANMVEWAPTGASARTAQLRLAAQRDVTEDQVAVKTLEVPTEDAAHMCDWLNERFVGSWQP